MKIMRPRVVLGLTLVQTVESRKGLSGKICPRKVPRVIRQIFQTIPKDFPLFVRLWASKTDEDGGQSFPMGLSVEIVGSDLLKSNRAVLNPDFGG